MWDTLMNAIAVLNLSNYLPTIARDAFQSAADRWGVKYIEITTPLGDCHHFWQKAKIPLSEHVAEFNRVLQLDADMLIAPFCPDPFQLVPEGSFGVVSRVQPHRRTFPISVQRWARHYGVTPYPRAYQHINAGLLLYEPDTHADLLHRWESHAESGRHRPPCEVPEQFVLSCLLAERDSPVYWLPWRFNACRQANGVVPQEAFIAHFHAPRRRPLEHIMRAFHFAR